MNETRVQAAIEEIRRRAPLMLDAAPRAESNLPADARFADDHEFYVSLPAWVFRALRATEVQCEAETAAAAVSTRH